MKKKILYIDMDGVVADFGKAVLNFCPTLDMNKFSDEVDEICESNPTIFHDLHPIEGSIEAVKKLFDHYEIYFLSTPMWNVPLSFTGKRMWIEKHFGEQAEKRLILTHRKDLNIGDYLVDDSDRHGVKEFRGEHIHFGSSKFPDWNIIYNYLISLI